MGPGKWGLERPSARDSLESLGWTTGLGGTEDGEEDHVAGLVERIAHTMLEEDDEETQQEVSWGGSLPPLLGAQSAAQVFASNWDKRRMDSLKALSGFPVPVQKRIESEAMELLYKELVKLKMEELAAAQQQLSFYQNAFMDSSQSSHSGSTSTVGLSSISPSLALAKQHESLQTFQNKQLHRRLGGGDWAAPHIMQYQGNWRSPGQRIGAPLIHPSSRYLARASSSGVPASRESGGTGVFLPRSRTGVRNLRTHDSRRKPELKFPATGGRPDTFLLDKAKENVVDRPSLQYPSCSPLQEVAPDISLPTEWTY